jgi:hypothetical protein
MSEKAPAPERPPIEVTDRGIILRSFEELQRFAKLVLESNAAPKGIDTVGKVAIAIQMGMERGMAPLGGLRAVYFVNGLPSWRGEAAVAIVRQSPLCTYYKAWVEGEGDARMGVCVTHRLGDKDPVRTEFSVKDAKKAGLWNKSGPWQEYPDRQVKWRAIGFNLKDQFPDLLGGFPLAEEAQDIPAEDVAHVAPVERQLAPAPPPDPIFSTLGMASTPAAAPVLAGPFASHAEADAALAQEPEQ